MQRKRIVANLPATTETGWLELRRLILEGSNLSYESLPAKEQEYTFSRLGTEMAERMEIQCLTKDILKTLELYTDRDGYNNAAALLADRNSFKGVDIVRFGSSINVIRDRHTLEGISVLQQYHDSIRIFQTYYQYEEIDGIRRRTVDQIPEKSFREAIANALVHRTWDVDASIRVSMFEDRIEISSPGGLPAGISKEEYLKGQVSILRNPILGNHCFDSGIMNICRSLRRSCDGQKWIEQDMNSYTIKHCSAPHREAILHGPGRVSVQCAEQTQNVKKFKSRSQAVVSATACCT